MPEEDRRVQKYSIMIACPRSIAREEDLQSTDILVEQEHCGHPRGDMMFAACPGCGIRTDALHVAQPSDVMRRCRRCDEALCERCVNEMWLCYMGDGAYPRASEQGVPKARESG